jgi:hypothetical protein
MALTQRECFNLESALALIARADDAGRALRYSYERRPELAENREKYDDEDWEHWDAFTARFARLADILTQMAFRAIDAVEFQPAGTLIDRLNRAEKRGHIRSAFEWKEIREIRNQIAHEYASGKLLPLLRDVVTHAPELLACVERLEA